MNNLRSIMYNKKSERDIAYIYNDKKIINMALRIKINILLTALSKKEHIKNIAIILDRSDDLLIAVLACLVGGYTYIPVDPLMPHQRIHRILDDGDADLILTSAKYYSIYKNAYSLMTMNEAYETHGNYISDIKFKDEENEIAYIIYTSGTTGNPKGVEITRQALCNFIEGISEKIEFLKGGRILCATTVSFDIFILETVVAFCQGVTIVFANDEEYQNPKLLSKLIEEKNVTMLQMTPSKMQLLINYDKNLPCLRNMKCIMIGGEAFPPKLLEHLKRKTRARIYNLYGPTEATVWVTACDLTDSEDITLGEPLLNTKIYIIDDDHNIIDGDRVGEIAIAGKCLAKCYHNDKALTDKKFIFLKGRDNQRAYKTGDLGNIVNGRLFFHGRIDTQVKIRGNRIELEEIEIILERHNAIKQAVAAGVNTNNNDLVLVAFIVEEEFSNDEAINSFLKKYLPEYMIPSKYVRVDKFEYTFNDKIDRQKLANTYFNTRAADDLRQPLNRSDEILNIIKDNIDQSIFGEITFDMELSASGIDSVTFIKTVVALEEHYEFEFDDDMLVFTEFTTVGSLVEYVETKVFSNKELV